MREYLCSAFNEYSYAEQDVAVLLSAYDKIVNDPTSEHWNDLLRFYDKKADFSIPDGLDFIQKARVIADKHNIHRYTAEFLLFLCMSKSLKRRYVERGLSDTMFDGVMQDFCYKLTECRLIHNIVGSFTCDWFIGFFTLNRFSFGRLQFELIPFDSHCEINGLQLTPEDRVINVHIPRTGTPLSPQACEEAYAQGARFFRETLGGKIVFHCSSWLLYPEHECFLPSHSNVLSFARRYTVIDSGEYGDDQPNLWRIFDTLYNGDPDALPNNSSLRRAYIKRLKNGAKTGWGKGVFAY